MEEPHPAKGGGPSTEGAGTAATTPTGAAPSTPARIAGAAARAVSPARVRAAAARAGTEARRAARGMPSRTYLVLAVASAALAALAGLAPVLAARVLLPTRSPAFATREQTLAGEALATVIEAARHGVSPKGLPSVTKTVGLVHPYDTLLRMLGSSAAVWALVAFTLRKAAFANKLSLVTYKRLALGLAAVGGLELALLPRMLANLSWTGVGLMTALAAAKVSSPARQIRGEGWWSLAKQSVRGMGLTPRGGRRAFRRRRGHGHAESEEEATWQAGSGGGAGGGGAGAEAAAAAALDSMGGALGFAYRLLALALAGGGMAYLLAPALTAKLALGTVGTAPARLLWQVMGASNAGMALLCLNLAMAAAQGRLAATTHTLECLALFFQAITHILLLARDYEAGRWGIGGPGLAALWGGALAAAVAGLPASHPAEALVGVVGGGGGHQGGAGGGGGGGGGMAHSPPVGGAPVEYEGGGHQE